MATADPQSPSFQMGSVEFAASGTRVPKSVLRDLKAAGADISRDLGLTYVGLGSNTVALEMYMRWTRSLSDEDDPLLLINNAVSPLVEHELNQILQQYATFNAAAIHGGAAAVPGWVVNRPFPPVRYHHAQMALTAVAVFMVNPGPAFASIHAQPLGTILGCLLAVWAGGTTVQLNLVRT